MKAAGLSGRVAGPRAQDQLQNRLLGVGMDALGFLSRPFQRLQARDNCYLRDPDRS